MKRILSVFWIFLLLTACAAEPQEIPQELPQEGSAPQAQSVPESEPAEPEFSEGDPDPVSYIFIEDGQRFAKLGGKKPAGETLEEMPAAPFVEHDAFYFPLQFVAEAMGVQYAFTNNCAYLQCDGHMTQFFMDSPRFIVDGVEGRVEGERRLYRKGRQYGPVDEHFTPVLRDGVVFLPVEYLPEEFRMSYNSFGPQLRIEDYGDQVFFQVFFQNDRWLPTEVKTAHAVTLYAGVSEALADGERVPLPAAPFVENDIFYYPVEAMAEWMEVGYSRAGDTFRLFTSDDDIQLFLNSRRYVLNGQAGMRETAHIPADDAFVPVERNGVVFLPSDFLLGDMGRFFLIDEYPNPEPGIVIFTHRRIEEDGIGGFYLEHKFDETPPELRAGLHCIGKLGEFDMDYDVIGYTGGGLDVHVLRLKPDGQNGGSLDGTISAVLTTNPEFSTPRGLRCGDLPRRAWELYAYGGGGGYPRLRYDCPDNGPISAIGFSLMNEVTVHLGMPYYIVQGVPDEWFDTPAFWESE